MRTYTTKEAAAVAGRTVDAFRAMMTQQRKRGGPDWRVPGIDARTPLWDADQVDPWAAQLPGNQPTKAPEPWQMPCLAPNCRGHQTRAEASHHATKLTAEAERLWRSIQMGDHSPDHHGTNQP